VTSITWTVFNETKIPARAAALSFGSLLGLGPLVAIAVLIGGFVLGKDTDPSLIANRLGELMEQVAPQLRQLNSLDASGNLTSTAASPEVVKVISDIIAAARSGVGVAGTTAGAFSIVLIVLLLFKSIEDAFNDIWGVRVGRSLLMRIVFYWTTLTLGAVLFFSSLALLGASAAVNVFQQFPGGSDLQALLRWMLPAFSLTFLVGMLTLVYRAVPNTHVFWRAAFVGAVVVAALLAPRGSRTQPLRLLGHLSGIHARTVYFLALRAHRRSDQLCRPECPFSQQPGRMGESIRINARAPFLGRASNYRPEISKLLACHFGRPTGRYAKGSDSDFERVPKPPRPNGTDYNVAPCFRNVGHRVSLPAGASIKPDKSQRIQKSRRQLWR
jgi:YihY family inner membrane protein